MTIYYNQRTEYIELKKEDFQIIKHDTFRGVSITVKSKAVFGDNRSRDFIRSKNGNFTFTNKNKVKEVGFNSVQVVYIIKKDLVPDLEVEIKDYFED